MSHTFDTVQRALSLVRDASNLTARQKDLLSFSQDVIDEWHTVNHDFQDVLNRNARTSEATAYLNIVIEEKDKRKQVERMNQYTGRIL